MENIYDIDEKCDVIKSLHIIHATHIISYQCRNGKMNLLSVCLCIWSFLITSQLLHISYHTTCDHCIGFFLYLDVIIYSCSYCIGTVVCCSRLVIVIVWDTIILLWSHPQIVGRGAKHVIFDCQGARVAKNWAASRRN